jgi:hypothetical protein
MTLDLYGFGPALAAGTLMTIKLALSALALGLGRFSFAAAATVDTTLLNPRIHLGDRQWSSPVHPCQPFRNPISARGSLLSRSA